MNLVTIATMQDSFRQRGIIVSFQIAKGRTVGAPEDRREQTDAETMVRVSATGAGSMMMKRCFAAGGIGTMNQVTTAVMRNSSLERMGTTAFCRAPSRLQTALDKTAGELTTPESSAGTTVRRSVNGAGSTTTPQCIVAGRTGITNQVTIAITLHFLRLRGGTTAWLRIALETTVGGPMGVLLIADLIAAEMMERTHASGAGCITTSRCIAAGRIGSMSLATVALVLSSQSGRVIIVSHPHEAPPYSREALGSGQVVLHCTNLAGKI